MEERREVLDVPAARAELPLAASVGADAALGAVVVGVEEPRTLPKRDGLMLIVRGGQGSVLDVLRPSGWARPR